MIVLGIESTCDETACAVVKDGQAVLSSIISSQIDDHRPWKGVVPELASRIHLEKIIPIIREALDTASVKLDMIDLVAFSNRPGLMGGLLVSVGAGKTLAWSIDRPFIGVNHIEAHLFSPHLSENIPFPYIALLVSGGHTLIVKANNYTDYEILGTTIDDAAGEAFDKIAKHFDLGYPGGPAVEKAALTGNPKAFDFPTSNLYKSDRIYDVSYSGIKTAVINHTEKSLKVETYTVNDIAASFQKKCFDILIKKVKLACQNHNIFRVVVAGGVSANRYMRERFHEMGHGYSVFFPDLKYATDNAAMISGYGYYAYKRWGKSPLNIGVETRITGYKQMPALV